jgi:hypothetical protein
MAEPQTTTQKAQPKDCTCGPSLSATTREALTTPLVPLEDFTALAKTRGGKYALGAAGVYLLYRLVVPKSGGIPERDPSDYDDPRALTFSPEPADSDD